MGYRRPRSTHVRRRDGGHESIQLVRWARLGTVAITLACMSALLVVPDANRLSPARAQSQAPSESAPLVRLPFPQDDGSLTPYTFELGYRLMTLVYDTLLWRDKDGKAQPWLARSVEPSADGRQLTIRLAEGARWHDGVPLTATDVAFTFQLMATHPHPRFTPQLAAVTKVEPAGPSTVVVSLRDASPGFSDQPLADLPIIPAHIWKALPPGSAAPPGLPVGSGPYRLVDYRPREGYRFEANAEYFRGPPAVQAIDVPFITEADATFEALERRRVDMVPLSLPGEAAARLEKVLGARVVRGPSYAGTVLMFNLRSPPFDRLEVRRAVAAALDLGRLARAAGDATPADRGYLHPESAWSAPEVLHRFDEGGAREQLARLALAPFDVLAPSNDPVKLQAARQVVQALQRVGARAEVKTLPRHDLSKAVGEDGSPPRFQAAIWDSPPLASHDPDYLIRVFGSDPRNAPLNLSGFQSQSFDQLSVTLSSALEVGARRSTVNQALRLLANDVPVVPLFFASGSYAYVPSVYDGWVFVKGDGILDKQSFLESDAPSAVSAPPVTAAEEPAGGGISMLGWMAMGVLGLALVIAAAALLRRRS